MNADIDDVLDDVTKAQASDPEPDKANPEVDDTDDPKAQTDPEPDQDDPKKTEPEQDDPDSTEKDDPKKDEPDSKESKEKDDPKPDKKKDNSVIRNLRQQQKETSKQNKEYEAMLGKIAKQQGISKEELVEKLQNEADEKEAKEKNITPEVQKQLREQEEALNNLKQERQREVFNTKFDKLSEEYPMDNDEAREFVEGAIEMGIDLGNPNTDFKAVYFALNHEKILEQRSEQVRQETLKKLEEQKKAPGTTKKRGQGDGRKKGDIDDVLDEIGV